MKFISEQLPINLDTGDLVKGFKNQYIRSLSNIWIILESKNSTLNNIIKLTVLLTVLIDDSEKFNEVNEVFEDFFNEPYPSRSNFEAV